MMECTCDIHAFAGGHGWNMRQKLLKTGCQLLSKLYTHLSCDLTSSFISHKKKSTSHKHIHMITRGSFIDNFQKPSKGQQAFYRLYGVGECVFI